VIDHYINMTTPDQMVQEMVNMVQKMNQMEANMAQLTQQNVILQQIADNGSMGRQPQAEGSHRHQGACAYGCP
jgi:hypothetical protein